MTTAPTSKIVIVAGNRFTVDAAADNEAIRQQLLAQGFADVASAEIKKGKEGETETVEFVKKAGTKGLDGPELAALLARVPPAPLPGGTAPKGLHPDDARLLRRLAAGDLTFQEALDSGVQTILAAAEAVADSAYRDDQQTRKQGEVLCQRCDQVPAAAAPSVW